MPTMALVEMPSVDGSPSLEARAAKRPRRQTAPSTANDDADCTSAPLTLPPEVWADVMGYLPFQSILSCSAVSRSMLHETMPRLTKLRIEKASQMNLTVAARFRDVTDIHVNSLLTRRVFDEGTPHEFTEIEVDLSTKIRVVPFLSRFVQTLERVYFGGKTEGGEVIEGFAPAAEYFCDDSGDGYPNECDRESMMAFVDSLSGAFQCGAFPKHLKISGICCPDCRDRRGFGGQCSVCQRACKSFPLESVIHFESRQSSISNAHSGRSYGLDVCLQMAQVESIIESRPGGKDLLRTDERLIRLLGSGRLYKIKSNDGGRALHIVKYTTTQLQEIKRVIAYAKLDVKKMTAPMLYEAILKSFGKEGGPIPPNNQRYLSEASLVYLIDEIGLCIDKVGFGGSLTDLVGYAQQISSLLLVSRQGSNINIDDLEYENIEIDCLKLLRRFLELENNPPIEHIEQVIPLLSQWLVGIDEYKIEAASSLKSILAKGTVEHRNMVIGAGVIPKFSQLLASSKDGIANAAVLALVDILTHGVTYATDGKREHIEAMVEAGGISRLVNLLDSSDEACVESALRLLAVTAEVQINSSIEGVLSHIIHLMKHLSRPRRICVWLPGTRTIILAGCSILLRKILEADNPPLQQVVDANLVPRLVEILNTIEDGTIQMNLAHVCIGLASGASWEQVDSITKEEAGFLALLVRLQDSPIDTISERAISCLEGIANAKSTYPVEGSDKIDYSGEYRVLQLVDSDEEESVLSAEEAVEVSNDEIELEEQQAIAANAPKYIEFTGPWVTDDEKEVSPSLLGIPKHLLETILMYATQTQIEVNVLETVCKKFHMIVKSNDDGEGFRGRHPSFAYCKMWAGLQQIRKYQKSEENEIMAVICGEGEVDSSEFVIYADKLRTLATDIMSRMHSGAVASFRLRGDTIGYLFELCQGYMVERLEQALLLAIHGSRTEVQRHDLVLLPSQAVQMVCNVGANEHGRANFFGCSCSLPSSGVNVWRWPEDDCCDVLPPNAGRRIIRRLASKAGINQMTSSAFDLAEAELLHTLGVLLVEASESSVQMAKNARFLDAEESLLYGMFSDVPPPPLSEDPNDEVKTICTIVPGQISAAAQRRNIRPPKVYCEWIASSGNSPEEEMEVEESYYYC